MFGLRFKALELPGNQAAVAFTDVPTPKEATLDYQSVPTSWTDGLVSAPTIGTAPRLGISSSGAKLVLDVAGVPGTTCALEYTDSLGTSAEWVTISSLTLTGSGQVISIAIPTNTVHRFYRARGLP